jgi:hypothetical protein
VVFSEPVQNVVTPAPKAAAPPANAFEAMIDLSFWGFAILMKNIVLTVVCIVLIGIGYVGWTQYRRKKKHEFLFGKR